MFDLCISYTSIYRVRQKNSQVKRVESGKSLRSPNLLSKMYDEESQSGLIGLVILQRSEVLCQLLLSGSEITDLRFLLS